MSFTVYVRRAAELDVANAQRWYEEQQAGLAAQFHYELSVVITRLSETLLIYPVVYRNIRRAVLRRFPYLVWLSLFWPVLTAN